MRFVVSVVALSVSLIALSADDAHAQRRGGGFGRMVQGAANAAGLPSVSEEVLVPSAISTDWAFLDAENPFAAGDDAVTYITTGMPAYDSYFANVAQLEGRLVLARDTLALANQILDSDLPQQLFSGALMSDIVGENSSLAPGEQRRFMSALMTGNFGSASGLVTGLPEERFNSVREQFLTENPAAASLVPRLGPSINAVTGLADNATGIVSSVQGMIDSAPSEFVGPNAAMAPRVLQELGNSVQTLRNIGNTAGEVLEQLRAIAN
jgi:hypothetical protein